MKIVKKNKKILAIIPARGGSKSIPKKNIKLLAGKPLIAYTIESALKSRYLDRVVVSTDDKEISKVSIKFGAEVIKRPEELAKDNSSMYPVIEHVLNYLEKIEKYKPDIVFLLQPTSPLRTVRDIDSAIKLFLKNKCASIVGVCESKHSVHWSFKIGKKYLEPMFDVKNLGLGRQKLPRVFTSNGAIFISTPINLAKYQSFFGGKILSYIMPADKSVDMDDKSDFVSAELLIRKMSNGSNKNRK